MITQKLPPGTPLTERIRTHSVITPEGCWEWQGHVLRNGYGQTHVGHTAKVLVHRAAYEAFVGPIPAGLHVDHVCHSLAVAAGTCLPPSTCTHRACCNPDHLEIVTPAENTRRGNGGQPRINAAKTHCKHGHEYTPENTYVYANGRACRSCCNARTRRRRALRKALAATS